VSGNDAGSDCEENARSRLLANLAQEKDMTLTLALILALIALVCGILMLVAGRWSKWPLAAVAIICLALNQTGLLKM
jgi:ABC-type amino acid transport system permease subunit